MDSRQKETGKLKFMGCLNLECDTVSWAERDGMVAGASLESDSGLSEENNS